MKLGIVVALMIVTVSCVIAFTLIGGKTKKVIKTASTPIVKQEKSYTDTIFKYSLTYPSTVTLTHGVNNTVLFKSAESGENGLRLEPIVEVGLEKVQMLQSTTLQKILNSCPSSTGRGKWKVDSQGVVTLSDGKSGSEYYLKESLTSLNSSQSALLCGPFTFFVYDKGSKTETVGLLLSPLNPLSSNSVVELLGTLLKGLSLPKEEVILNSATSAAQMQVVPTNVGSASAEKSIRDGQNNN